jgi:hypothetical protein
MNDINLHFVYSHYDGLRGIKRFRKIRSKYAKLIKEESKIIGLDVKHYLSVKKRNTGYNGLSGCLLSEYAIAFPRNFENAKPQLQRYWIRHELRHCNPIEGKPTMKFMNKTFRKHDVEVSEVDVEYPHTIGFFYEDFDEIKCCDVLMQYYQHCPIEEFLM